MKVTIKRELLNKLWYWTDNAKGEISGMGKIMPTKDGFRITNLYLLEQECTGASTDIDSKALAKLMYTSREDEGTLSLWWHTHADMGVFWSGTDTATIKELSANGMLLALVVNKKHEYKCRYSQQNCAPYANIDMDDVNVTPIDQTTQEQEDAWKKELLEKVKEKTYEAKNFYGHGDDSIGGWHRGYPESMHDDDVRYVSPVAPVKKKHDEVATGFNISKQTKAVQDKCAAMYAWCFKVNATDAYELEDFFNTYFKELESEYDDEMLAKEESKKARPITNSNRTGGKTGCKYYNSCGSEANCSRCIGFDKPLRKER